ncbi:MAG: hypothetical protein ACYC99_01235 [Candidatus Geothermincolia bacterium]
MAHPAAEVILYGESKGTAEASRELGVSHVPIVPSAPSGVPYFNGIVAHAAEHGKHDLQVYVNCDILLAGIYDALKLIEFPRFLLIGERIDLMEEADIGISQVPSIEELSRLAATGLIRMHGPTGIDYFAFRRGSWKSMPDVIIGRAGYDGALLAHCLRNRIPIVDGTAKIIALHQFHGYEHVPGGSVTVRRGEDAQRNFSAVGSSHSALLVSDADFVMLEKGIISKPCRQDRLRHFELLIRYRHGRPLMGLLVRLLWRALAAIGVVGVKNHNLKDILSGMKGSRQTCGQVPV